MSYLFTQFQCFLKALTALCHQLVVGVDTNAAFFKVDNTGKKISRPIKQRACKHRRIDSLPLGGAFTFVGLSGYLNPISRRINSGLSMVERTACQNKKKVTFGRQRFFGRWVITDPVAIIEDVGFAVNLFSRSVCDI